MIVVHFRITVLVKFSKIVTYYEYVTRWCLKLPPRCRIKIIKSKIENFRQYIAKKKPVDYCCDGFMKSSENTCKPFCPDKCIHGECVAPDTCRCKDGYNGHQCDASK